MPLKICLLWPFGSWLNQDDGDIAIIDIEEEWISSVILFLQVLFDKVIEPYNSVFVHLEMSFEFSLVVYLH